MSEAIVNLGANTGPASAAIAQLNNQIKDVGDSTQKVNKEQENLEATLKRQESTIKTIDGVINLLGGSVELLASSLVLSGAATEEQAKEFEAAALGAIAFADGTKRTFDGVKSLNEGLKEFGGITGVVTKAFNALKAAAVANPFTAVAVAIGVVVSALLIYNETTKESTEDTEEYKKAVDGLNKSLRETQKIAGVNANSIGALSVAFKEGKISQEQYVAQLKELGVNLDGVNLSSEKNIKLVNDLATANNNIASQQAKRTKLEGELKLALEKNNEEGEKAVIRLRNEIAELDVQTSSYTANRDAILATFDTQKKANEQKPTSIELTKQETTEVLNYVDAVNKRNKAIKEGIEGFIEGTGGIEKPVGKILKQLPTAQAQLETTALTFSEKLRASSQNLNDFFESETGKAISQGLQIASTFSNLLLQAQDDSTEESFESSKKYKIAQVVTSAAQSAFEAFASAQKLNTVVPGLGTAVGVALVAAIGAASNKAIQDIQNSSFNSPGSPSVSTGGGTTPNISRQGTPNLGGGFVTGAGVPSVSTPVEPIRAYVVTGDVVNGVQASGQLRRRRTLGPG